MVSELTFYSDDPSSNPADAKSFSVKFVFEKNENKQKETGVGPFFKKTRKSLTLPASLFEIKIHHTISLQIR